MNEYTPDRWVLLEFTNQETGESITKVFGGWVGGYTQGDSWKLSSGVVGTEDRDDYWEFTNHSGSVYRCYKHAQGMSGYMTSIYQSWMRKANSDGSVTIGVLNQ